MTHSVQRRRAIQAGMTGAVVVDPPPLPRHEEVDLLLKQSAKRLELGFMDFLELADEAIQGKFYERFGFQDAAPYFAERIGCSYRTLCRGLAVLEAIRGLPAGQMPAAKEALAELGSHKSSILAPAFAKEPDDWQDWVELARRATEEALQDAVSSALGHRARGGAKAPGEKFLVMILNSIPPERREQTSWVFQEMAKMGDPTNVWSNIAVFLQLVIFGEQELSSRGIIRDGH